MFGQVLWYYASNRNLHILTLKKLIHQYYNQFHNKLANIKIHVKKNNNKYIPTKYFSINIYLSRQVYINIIYI